MLTLLLFGPQKLHSTKNDSTLHHKTKHKNKGQKKRSFMLVICKEMSEQ